MIFTNLFIGYNRKEDFRILICSFDEEKAAELANEYRLDAGLEGISRLKKQKTELIIFILIAIT